MENRIEFTEEMRKTHTILIPNMLPVHFELIANVLVQHGYKIELLKNEGRAVVDAGLSMCTTICAIRRFCASAR